MATLIGRRQCFSARLRGCNSQTAIGNSAGEQLESRMMLASDFQLVSDINTAPITAGSSIGTSRVVGERLFFTAVNRTQGEALWVSDGTTAGTQMLFDVSSLDDLEDIRELTEFKNQLYFVADGGLFKSDGTTAGTRLVKDFQFGSDVAWLTVVNDQMFFVAPNGAGLWRTDGTTEGTTYLKDVVVAGNLVNVSGTLYFSAAAAFLGSELWSSDGTAQGTKMVKDIREGPESSSPSSLRNVGGVLFFVARDGLNGFELWRSTGSAENTKIVADINPGNNTSLDSLPSKLTVVENTLYFVASNEFLGAELWRAERDSLGAQLVKDLNPGAGSSHPHRLRDVNGTLFLFADDGVLGHALWKTDGTSVGTLLVKDINAQDASGGKSYSIYSNQINFNNTLYFTVDDGQTGFELWRSDGTSGGTSLVKDIRLGSSGSTPRSVNAFQGKLFFAANDGQRGLELWQSDGTESGTSLVKDIFSGTRSSAPGNLTNVNGQLYFTANDGTAGYELWRSDGRAADTRLVADIASGSTSSFPSSLTNVNGILYFKADDSVHGNALWYAAPGTEELLPVLDPFGNYLQVISMVNFNGSLIFTTNQRLWAIDQPLVSSTVRLIRDGVPMAFKSNFTEVNGRLFFQTNDLWVTDGTTSGTLLVKNINPTGGDFPYDNKPVNVGGVLYFVANDGTQGDELWRSDGTTAGTMMVKDIFVGARSSGLKQLTEVGGVLYMAANDGTTGLSLWRSNGTSAGTYLVKDFDPASNGENFQPKQLTNLNGTLKFTVDTVDFSNDLWESNGTEAGTQLVVDLLPDTRSKSAVLLGVIDEILYFSAQGAQLWQTDGSAAGTSLVQTTNARNAPFGVTSVVSTGDSLFITAITEEFGREVFVAGRFAWQNYALPTDVSADGNVTPFDALLIINRLNQNLPSLLPNSLPVPFSPATYFDVNGDGNVTALDALLVINQINANAEGEATAENQSALTAWELVNDLFLLDDIGRTNRLVKASQR